ncbi:MAG: PEP-CTERM sorting domain-containing protein [Phenylobacterium sp.]|uniref:PEPxxWA-CTERM sorting domain-containing protein n=1 Tax=Phenylobacterium sp. TaxID=1871053 RepID=UPI0025DCE110|nr:PEPxxWA-CTERM sorting domain-containing protein [Phenylobacterium sp.]MBI1199746.1 PEP-CTERM sorting domain-containing protein [Phenylobacterium sp.]
MAVGVALAGVAYRGDVIVINRLRAAAAAVALALPLAAHAGVIYDNLPTGPRYGGYCFFNTTCAANHRFVGDNYAAQLFTLADAATIKSAGFVEMDLEVYGTSVNWKFYLADGAGGLPGTLVTEGSSAILASTNIDVDHQYNISLNLFDLPSISLDAGDYYFALQLVSPVEDIFLTEGLRNSGAAETNDGGASWSAPYEELSSVGVALYGTIGGAVPEPATWALMIMGFGGAGAMLRRRSRPLIGEPTS